MDKQPRANRPIFLGLMENEPRKFIVNTVPIMDNASMVKGALLSFHDVTELDRANSQLREANSELESYRVQILEKDQELEKTNTSLLVEMNERKRGEEVREELYRQLMQVARQTNMGKGEAAA